MFKFVLAMFKYLTSTLFGELLFKLSKGTLLFIVNDLPKKASSLSRKIKSLVYIQFILINKI